MNSTLLSSFSYTTTFRIDHTQKYVKLGFEYRVQIVLAQTNCSKPLGNQVCVRPEAANPVGKRYYDFEGFEERIQGFGLDDLSLGENDEEETYGL